MIMNFGFSDWAFVFFVIVAIAGVVSIKGVKHDIVDEDHKVSLKRVRTNRNE